MEVMVDDDNVPRPRTSGEGEARGSFCEEVVGKGEE